MLRLVARGLSNKEIGHSPLISAKTAGTLIEHIYAKIGTPASFSSATPRFGGPPLLARGSNSSTATTEAAQSAPAAPAGPKADEARTTSGGSKRIERCSCAPWLASSNRSVAATAPISYVGWRTELRGGEAIGATGMSL